MWHNANDILMQLAAAGSTGMLAVLAISTSAFLALYFGLATAVLVLTRRVLPRVGIGAIVETRPLREGQLGREIRRSLVSILIFGGYGLLTFEAWRRGVVAIDFEVSWSKVVVDTAMLVIWNEVHFYGMHRLLHTGWLYRNVHRIHHESAVPTPFSTYSFHPLEAVLLGSVMILPMFLYKFIAPALLALPVVSIFFNTIGHSNYNLFAHHPAMRSASVEHMAHHLRVRGNYGFYLPFLDRWANTVLTRSAK